MIKYVNPIPPLLNFFEFRTDIPVYGNRFPSDINNRLPALLVRTAGGLDYTRLMILSRAESDITAMNNLITVMNRLIAEAANIQGLRVLGCEMENNPVDSIDQDTNKPEAWVYIRLEHLEA